MHHRPNIHGHALFGRHAFFSLFVGLLLATFQPAFGALIGYWNFDESSGTTANDTSGRVGPLNGTLSASGAGAAVPAWIAGRFGNGLDFNQNGLGAGGLVTVPYNGDLRLSNAFTISFWWRPDYTPAASTFPGIVRIGSQSAVPPTANAGWGFYRSQPNVPVYKRGNHQPTVYSAMTVGNWHHIALTHDGAGNNVAFFNGVMVNFTTNWPALTTTANLEFGRMDSFDNAGLDDFALFNERITLAKVRSLYTLPANLGLGYDLATMRALWNVFDSGPGSSGVVGGATWYYTNSLPGSTTLGDSYLNGVRWFVVLSNNVGVAANATLLGDLSPNGIGLPGTMTFSETPTIGTTARFVFDLNTTTDIGGGTNDLFVITGDLNLAGQSVVVNPIGPLATGTYRLFNYTGAKTGSLNPVVLGNTRYTLSINESTPGQIDLTVSGSNADVRWVSAANANWNFTTTNWLNVGSGLPDTFFNADTATFNDALVYATNITISAPVYPSAVSVNSSTLNYTLGGQPIRGMAGGLTKTGSSLLTLSGANGFFGPVNLDQGSIRLGSTTALGLTNGGTVIGNGATLDLGGFLLGTEPITVSGAGIGGTGAVVNTGAGIANNGLNGVVTLAGDTTLGGNNRFDLFGGTLFGGGYTLTKTGLAEIALSNLRDTQLGNIEVQAGQLTILGSTTMGDPSRTVTVRSNATFAHWASGTNRHNKPLVMQWARLLNGTSPADNATNIATVSITGTNTFDGASSLTLLNEISGSGALTKNAAGTLSLGGTNIYAGPTTINGGSLSLVGNGSIGTTPLITIASGAKLNAALRSDGTLTLNSGQVLAGSGTVDGSVVAGTSATASPGFSAGTLTITNAFSLTGDATLVYELTSATNAGGGINDLINVGGALSLSGSNVIRVAPVGLLDTVNQYTLINYTGALSGDSNNLTAVSDSRMSFNIDTASTPGKVLLNVTNGAPAAIQWVGGEPGAETLWNLQTTPNWTNLVQERFFAGDRVSFDDTAAQFGVTLVGELYPGAMDVAAGVNDFTFSGTGRLRGGSLTKANAGKLTIANTGLNDYPGLTVINGGILQVGNGGAFGNLGPNTITNNATLVLNRSDDLAFANTLFGSGTLRKEGGNLLTVGASLAGFDGTIAVSGGRLRPTAATALGTAVGGTVINSGGTLDLNALNLGAEVVTAQGSGVDGNGAIVNASATAQTQPLRYVTLSGDTTVGGVGRWDIRNPGAGGSLTGNGYTLTKTNANQVSLVGLGDTGLGDVIVEQGIFSVETTTGLGLPAGTVRVQPGATFMLWGSTVVQDKRFALNGGARLFKDNGAATITGTGTVTGSNAVDAASNSGTDLTLGGIISGPGMLNKIGAGSLFLTADNDYIGGTMVSAGILSLGNSGTAGNVLGNIINNASLFVRRSDAMTLNGNITGTGTLGIRSPNGVTVPSGISILLNGSIQVGQDVAGKMVIENGAVVSTGGQLLLGNPASIPGEVVQTGGDVWVALEARIGHYPTETSTYIMGGGTLNVTNVPTGTAAERNGNLYIGVDGTGIFTQTGGVARAHGIVLDNRGDTPGVDTMNLEGGRFIVGPSGIGRGNATNTTYLINLGGGTIGSSANWTSVLNMTLTGINGDTTLDTDTYTNTLSGALSGVGGLIKAGPGRLVLNGTNSYAGLTTISDGTLIVNNVIGAGFGQINVTGGTLGGNGVVNDFVQVDAGGTVAPGTSIGRLTISNDVFTLGTILMEISKSGGTVTNDQLVSSASLTFDGTLTVVASGDALGNGDSFDLFEASSLGGAFATINLPPLGPNLVWDTADLYTTGIIRVAVDAVPSLSFKFNGGNLELSWPGGFGGFELQAQTNAPGIGITTNWVTVPTTTNFFSFPPSSDPAAGSVFFRLILP